MATRRVELPKHVTWEILEKIPYPDIIRFCQISKGLLSQCQNTEYWQYRIRNEFGVEPKPGDTMRTYGDLHRCLRTGEFGECAYRAAKWGDNRLFEFYIDSVLRDFTKEQSEGAARAAGLFNRPDIINRIFNLSNQPTLFLPATGGQYVIFHAIEGAAEGNHQKLIEDLIPRSGIVGSRTYVDAILAGAARGNNWELINKYYRGTVDDQNTILANAAAGGQRELVDQSLKLGAQDFKSALNAASRHGYLDLVDKFIKLGTDNLDTALASAARGGHRNIVAYLIQLGAKNLDAAISAAIAGNHKDVILNLIRLGLASYQSTGVFPIDFKRAIRGAIISRKTNTETINALLDMATIVETPTGHPTELTVKDLNRLLGRALEHKGASIIELIEHGADDVIRALVRSSGTGDLDTVHNILVRVNENRPNRLGRLPTLPPGAINKAAIAAAAGDKRDVLLYLINLGRVNLRQASDAALQAGNHDLVDELTTLIGG